MVQCKMKLRMPVQKKKTLRDGSVQRFPSWSVYVNLALSWLVWTVADVQGL